MRTRSDAQQEAFARRLALLRADPGVAGDGADGDGAGWWEAHTSVPAEAGAEPAGEPGPGGAPVAVAVPVPGRHASRRRASLAPRWPEVLRGRASIGSAQLAVVALVLVAALVLTCWWLVRGRATTLSTPVAPSAAASPLVPGVSPVAASLSTPSADTAATGSAPTGSGSPGQGAMVTVDIEGKVRRPGIVLVPSGSRVTDALDAAGGVPHRHDLRGLNLAAVLVDGQQIVVGSTQPGAGAAGTAPGAASLGATGATGTTTGDGALVNLNTATSEQLDTLPGVGPVTAQSILEWREQNGGFTSVQELLEVDGIGPATLAKLTPHVTV